MKLSFPSICSKDYRDFIKDIKVKEVTKESFRGDKLLFNNFINCYRDVFGHRGGHEWGEYKKCRNCSKVYSIEDIYGAHEYRNIVDIEAELEPQLYLCDCGGQLEYFYNKENILEKINLLFKKKWYSFIIIYDESNNRIVGFMLGYIDSASNIWNDSLNKIFSDNIIKTGKLKGVLNDELECYVDELGIIQPYRKGKYPLYIIINKFFQDFILKRIDLIIPKKLLLWTSKQSKAYHLIKRLKHNVVAKDENQDSKIVISLDFPYVIKKVRFFSIYLLINKLTRYV